MNKKNFWKYIVGAVLFFLFPFILNWMLLQDAFVPVVGDSTTWLSFWPVYLSAMASFGMIYMTYLSLKQSREQLEDLKKREDDERRTRLVFSVITYQTAFYLRILNIGKENAFDVKLNINEEFINELKESNRKYFTKLSDPFFIEAGRSVYIFMGWCEHVNKEWEGKNITLAITGSYNEKYSVNESLDMGYFTDKIHFMVKSELETTMEYMKKGLIVQTNGYMPVQKSLDMIAHTIKGIDCSLMELSKQIEKTEELQNSGDKSGDQVENIEDAPDDIHMLRD